MESVTKIKRQIRYGAFALVFLILCAIAAIIYYMPTKSIQPKEIRVFFGLFLLFIFLIVLVMIMIRNAVAVNTGFLIRLRDQMIKHGQSMESMEKEMRNSTTTFKQLNKNTGNVATELNELNQHLRDNADSGGKSS